MLKISTIKEAISHALTTEEPVEFKMRGTKLILRKEEKSLHVEYLIPDIDDVNIMFRKEHEFDVACNAGISAIAQAIDMHYAKVRGKAISTCVTVMNSLRAKADIYVMLAKVVERLMKAK